MKVMTVERVYRVKGTQLVGRLECDVRVGEKLTIGSHTAVLSAIENYARLRESAKAGEGVALMFRNIQDVEIPEGTVVTKDG
jgi:translation elongation factor EF-Tu-like GTPase